MLRPHPSSTKTVPCFWTTVHSWPWQSLPWDYRILFLIEFSFVELWTIFHFMRIPECGAAGYGVGGDMMRWTYWIVRVRENPAAWGSCRDRGGCRALGKRVTVRQETSASICSNINRIDVVGTCCYCAGSISPARSWPGSALLGQAAPCGLLCQTVDVTSGGIWEYPVAIFLFKGTVFF